MILGSIFVVGVDLYYKNMVKVLIDDILINKKFDQFYWWAFTALIILTLNYLSTYLYYYVLIKRYTLKAVFDIRKIMIKNLLQKKYLDFTIHDKGYYLSKITEDAERIGEYINVYWYVMFSNTIRFIITISMLFWLSIKLTLVLLMIMPVYYLVIRLSRSKIENSTLKERTSGDIFLSTLSQVLDCFKVVKVYRKESFFFNKVKLDSDQWEKANITSFLYVQMYSMIGNYISSIAPLVVLGYGTMLIINGDLSIGKMMAFYLIMSDLYIPIDELFRFFTNKNSVIPVFKRNTELLALSNDIDEDDNIVKDQKVEVLELNNVDFSFDNHKIISNFSKKFVCGKIYCITGANGSGKSTLINILTGIYHVDKKAYLPIANLGHADQSAGLFPASIDENIWFDENHNKNKYDDYMNIVELKQKTGNHYSKDNLSGGEKQRISLTRALNSKSSFILLDEPTNHLDTYYVDVLKQKIKQLTAEGKSIICVSHDLEMIKLAHEVVSL